jgi:hypothetical protein
MILDDITRKQLIWYGHSREWTKCDYRKLRFTGNLKEGKTEAVPGEPGKMEYKQP